MVGRNFKFDKSFINDWKTNLITSTENVPSEVNHVEQVFIIHKELSKFIAVFLTEISDIQQSYLGICLQ